VHLDELGRLGGHVRLQVDRACAKPNRALGWTMYLQRLGVSVLGGDPGPDPNS